MGRGLSVALRSDSEDTISQFESINKAARLLTDLQREETGIRSSLILKNIQCTFKDLKEDEWLFGKSLNEKVKAAKIIQRDQTPARDNIHLSLANQKATEARLININQSRSTREEAGRSSHRTADNSARTAFGIRNSISTVPINRGPPQTKSR